MSEKIAPPPPPIRRSGSYSAPRSAKPRRPVRRRLILWVFLIAIFGTLAFAGWTDLYRKFLETTPPTITLQELPRGVGLAPVSLTYQLTDTGSGLDEVVVRIRQRGNFKEIKRESLKGKTSEIVAINFPGDKSMLEEGTAEIEVRAFDRSLWSNKAERTTTLRVDYRKPRIEVVSTQHNAREGGSQLIFYKVFDEDLGLSGVKVGNQTFLGFSAHSIDAGFDDRNLFVAIYAIDLNQKLDGLPLKVFAEDQVGNASSTSFYNKVQRRSEGKVTVTLRDDYLRDEVAALAERNFSKVQSLLRREGIDLNYHSARNSDERLLEQLRFVQSELRRVDQDELMSLLKGPRFERYWDGTFMRAGGAVRIPYGVNVSYNFGGHEVSRSVSLGYLIDAPRDTHQVLAANDGIVAFSENIGSYGSILAIDHGLGLSSLYSDLEQTLVQKGERVSKGQPIALGSRGGVSNSYHYYFEMRVHGVPVDPGEWMDGGWYGAHVAGKINDVKGALGIPIYRQLE